ncbi:IDEAL domain-containing protein [Bacillus salipaludis]|uniref:IDEAL domain-containing protein n=2 Tax=Bacillus salipaludis TaxID=2547811 RepID=A0ABW8RR97_9BACI
MTMADNYRFENGDWVQGRSRDGELIHGYVETVDSIQEIVKVKVIECDNDEAINKSIWLLNKRAEKLPDLPVSNESQLLSLIDLALLSKDEQWFMELSTQLADIKKKSKVNNKKSEVLISGDRIRNFDAKR